MMMMMMMSLGGKTAIETLVKQSNRLSAFINVEELVNYKGDYYRLKRECNLLVT
jgi:hypothetical protein